jgi:hypothetical protein
MAVDQKERVWHAREVVRLLLKSHKMRKLYGPGHAYSVGAVQELGGSIRSFARLHHLLRFEVTRDALVFEAERVYEEPHRDANIAFGIHLGGVRSIAFKEGLADEELSAFLEVLSDRGEEKDISAVLWERDFQGIECVCLDVLAEGWDAPEDLSPGALARLAEMNAHADRIIERLEARRLLGEGGAVYEPTDTGAELEKLAAIQVTDVEGDPGEILVQLGQERLPGLQAEVQTFDYGALLRALVEVALDGLALRPRAIGVEGAAWLLAEAPAAALRRNDLRLVAGLVERYVQVRPVAAPAASSAIDQALAALATKERVEALVALGTSAGALAGPLTQVLRYLGDVGLAAAVTAYLGATGREVRDALSRFLAEHVVGVTSQLERLLAPDVPAETARWALFLVSKSSAAANEALYDLGRQHPAPVVSDYALFLWRTHTSRGRQAAFLDALSGADVQERVRAANTLARSRDPEALLPLKQLIDDASFVGRTPEEKRALLAAVAAIAGAGATEFLRKQSRRQTGFFRARAGTEIREAALDVLKALHGAGGVTR